MLKKIQGRYILRLTGIMAVTTALSFALNIIGIGKENTLMLFIVGVLLVAYSTNGYQYGIIASIVSVMAFNYLFTEPIRTFSISNQNDVILLIFFMLAALISSNLTVRFQKQLKVSRENEELARKLSAEQEKIKYAMEKEQLRSQLLRGISHDLRTPLTVIAGASNLIAESDGRLEDENIVSLAKDISNQAEWLIRMIENILNMTKIDSGNFLIDKKPEAVEDVINNAVTNVKGRIAERKIAVDIPKDVLMVEMDGKMIVQVFVNLLDNAIKHTDEDGEIYIRVGHEEGKITFSVEDNGTGISSEIREHIFDEFVTGPRGTQDAAQGIGLGLAICKAIVNAHGGEIRAENGNRGGAVFSFSIPYKELMDYGEGYYNSGC